MRAEPRVPNPPVRVWRDWVVVGIAVPAAILEGVFRTDHVSLRPSATLLVALICGLLLWRRTHPLATFMAAFGGVLGFDFVAVLTGHDPLDNYVAAVSLIFVYSLFRWGSGRELIAGASMCVAITVVANALDFNGWGDVIGGSIVLLVPVLLAEFVRYQRIARDQAREQVKIQERELIARELHDTVAHHVSAIAIQAQAGRFLAQSNSLEGAADALEVIEEEAARALTEMRSMITVLRDVDTPADFTPQHGINDIDSLSGTFASDAPEICVTLLGDLGDVRPAIGAATYRLAQESITNAVRHAAGASLIEVVVEGHLDSVELRVNDDGGPNVSSGSTGFGLIGMQERAALVGGRLDAGPSASGGWAVRASLPRQNIAKETV